MDLKKKLNSVWMYRTKKIHLLASHLPLVLLENSSVWHGVEEGPETGVTAPVVVVVEEFSGDIGRYHL